jgi:hypothetical protein
MGFFIQDDLKYILRRLCLGIFIQDDCKVNTDTLPIVSTPSKMEHRHIGVVL